MAGLDLRSDSSQQQDQRQTGKPSFASRSEQSRMKTFVIVVIVAAALYLPLLSTNYDLNGMAEAAGVNSGTGLDLFLPNHMLYRPIGYFVRQSLAAAGIDVGAVAVLQVLSAVFGALGIGFVYLMLDRLVRNRSIALWTSLLLAVSWSYWTMSTDIYYLSLSAMFVAAAVAVFVHSQSSAALTACGVLAALAILSFQANVFLLPGLGAAIFLTTPPPPLRLIVRRVAVLWGSAAVVVGAAFVSVGVLLYERRTVAELLDWGSSYTGKPLPMWGTWALERFWTIAGTSFKSVLGLEFWLFGFFPAWLNSSAVPMAIAILGAAILGAGLLVAFRLGPAKKTGEARTVAWLLILYAVYIPFFIWWDPNEPRWFNISNIFIAGLTAIIASRWWQHPYARVALPAAVLILGGLNLAMSAWPRRFVTSTPLQMAACVADQMSENDLFLATEWNWAGYLRHLHDREVLSFIEKVADTGDKQLATEEITAAVRQRQAQGGSVYMIDVRSFPPEYKQWFTGQTGYTIDEMLAFRGVMAFECVYSPFIRLDPL